ncbi:MAG: lytic transglycosylase domain-containing protein, partial [Cystobacter sp.]
PGNVRGHVPRNGETEFYVNKVLTAYARHRPPPPPAAVKRVPRPTRSSARHPPGDRPSAG